LMVDDEGEHLIRYKLSYSPDTFEFKGVEPGEYVLVAFNDRNADLIYQVGEPASSEELRFRAKGGGTYADLTLHIDPAMSNTLSMSLDMSNSADLDFKRISRGEITTIDDPRFSAENGSIGMWEPLRFIDEVGGGLFLLEPYDPKKIPVLFVHGLGGNPSEFSYFIERLDHEHFQAWVAYYPSHVRMETASGFLHELTQELHAKYEYKHLYVVGHSMGGLVGRGFIDEVSGDSAYAKSLSLLVTLCTPWNGSGAAKMGLKYSNIVAPAWIDLAPGSPFLRGLGEKDLPVQLPFYLMFAYLDGESDDGTVSISSALHAPVQRKAKRVYGYESKHAGVLRNEVVSDDLNRILKTTREGQQ